MITLTEALSIGIPSAEKFYRSSNGDKIPQFTAEDNLLEDIGRYINKKETLYRIFTLESDTDPDRMFNLVRSGQTNLSWSFVPLYKNLLQRVQEGLFKIIPDRMFVQSWIDYPLNPSSDPFEASQLAVQRDPDRIQVYLHQRGITHFRSSDIIEFPTADIFFWCTRFYGPIHGTLTQTAAINRLFRLSRSSLARNMLISISDRSRLIRFENFLNRAIQIINQTQSVQEVMDNLQITSFDRFQSSLEDYLPLTERPLLSPFRFSLAFNLGRPLTVEDIQDYTDQELETLLGPISAKTRSELLITVVNIFNAKRAFLLSPHQIDICQNRRDPVSSEYFTESKQGFIGLGILSQGLRCYYPGSLALSLQSFQDSEGYYTFVDPLDANRRITEDDLLLLSQLPVPEQPVFQEYLQIYRQQADRSRDTLRQIRTWIVQGGADIVRKIFETLFYAGMYMRQWPGPGYPYPYSRKNTGQRVEGSAPLDVEERILSQLNITINSLNSIDPDISSLIGSLPYKDYVDGKFIDKPSSIHYYLTEIIDNGYCTRLASTPTIYTGIYYLRLLLGDQEISNFDLSKPVVNIT